MTPVSSNPAVSSVSNSTTETNIAASTIAANSLSDGDYLDFQVQADHANNSGSTNQLHLRVHFGAEQYQILALNIPNATNLSLLWHMTLARQGSSLVLTMHRLSATYFGATFIEKTFTPDFTSDNDLTFTAQWSAASADSYVNGNSAKLLQY